MDKTENRFIKWMYACILIMLAFPWFQYKTHFYLEKPLNGVFDKVSEPVFTSKDWEMGTYQLNFEKWFNQEFGFRNFFIRLHNQIEYSVFRKSNAKTLIVGKDRYLFGEDYIKTHYGDDFIGHESLKEKIRKIKAVRDTLQKLGKDIFVVFAPSKVTFYPEKIPDRYKKEKKLTNREAYVAAMAQAGLPHLDLASLTYSKKETSQYPLFTKTGLHWSNYCADVMMDTLVRYTKKLRNHDLPEFIILNTTFCDTVQDPDDDLEKSMNLLFRIPSFPLAYNNIEVRSIEKNQYRTLVIGDSYYWQMGKRGLSLFYFKDAGFWYYNKLVYPESWGTPLEVSQLNFGNELSTRDTYIIFTTEQNLTDLGWGFIENMYNYYYTHSVLK